MISPIFIFSLPRSGSILLPLVYSIKLQGSLTEYSHSHSFRAINDFIEFLPNQKNDYYKELNLLVKGLYEKHCKNGEFFFLDKTPRYYLIIPEIAKIFPEAKFIFLFRNPVQIMSSMMETWSNNNFKNLYHYDTDLKRGPKLLSEGYELLKDRSYSIRYEDLINSPTNTMKGLCEFLNVIFENGMLQDFSRQKTHGSMGDPTGTKKYQSIKKESFDKWKKTFNNLYRLYVVKSYIQNLDKKTLHIQGYDKEEILISLKNCRINSFFSFKDIFHVIRWKVIVKYNLNIFAGRKTSKWIRGRMMS